MQNKLVDITIGTQMAGVVSFQLWDTRTKYIWIILSSCGIHACELSLYFAALKF